MKKIFAFSLVAAMCVVFAACGGSGTSSQKEQPSQQNTQGQTESSNSSSATTQEPATTPDPKNVTISETVLLDEANVKVTAKSLETGGIFGPEIKLLIENDSGKDLTFQCRNSSVNGYMIDTMMSVEVGDGKKANDSLTFTKSDLKEAGIEIIADIDFSLHIFTTEGWETYLDTPQIQIETSAAEAYEYMFDDSGDLAYSGEGIKIVTRGLSEDQSILGPSIVVYIENNSDENVTVQARDVSINGFMVDTIFSSDVLMGKRVVDTITFLSSDLEENGITSIEDVELSFHIFDSAGWDTVVDTDPITLTF